MSGGPERVGSVSEARLRSHKYLPLFLAEATEQLEALSSELVRLEQEPPAQALWDSIFRRVHSVKGSAATLGFSAIVDVAHQAETLIGRLKAQPERPSREQVDLLFEATDALVEQVRRVTAEASSPLSEPREGLVERLAKAAQALPDPVAKSAQPPPADIKPQPAPNPMLPLVHLVISLAKTCAAPGARALIVQRKLKVFGSLMEMDPQPAQLMSQRGGARIHAVLATTRSAEEVRDVLVGLPEVEKVEAQSAAVARTQAPPGEVGASQTGAADGERASLRVVEHVVVSESAGPPDPEVLRPEPTVRVRAEALDKLLDQAAEVLHGIARLRETAKRMPENVAPTLESDLDRLRRVARELHGRVMDARLTPFSALTERLPRAVRDLSHRLGKEVDLEIQGADVEFDRTVIEAMGDPLSHLMRNAVDHGIERAVDRLRAGKLPRGRLVLSARRERDKAIVELQDDGRGLDAGALRAKAIASGHLAPELAEKLSDAEACELAFLPGLSTRDDATDVSGRGVGLDAVQRTVETLGGKISIRSVPGKGAKFVIELPLSLSIATLLLVQVGGELYGIPLHRVLLTTEYDLSGRGGEGFEARSLVVLGQLVRAYRLAKLFGLPSLAPPGPRPFVVVDVDGQRFALAVDRLVGQEEAVLKPLFPPLDRIRGLAGVTVLGNGRPLLVLDTRGLAELCGVHEPKAASKGAA